jgi:glycosyltransferase EpsF
MVKVLHITGTMNMGGAEVMLMDLLRYKSDNIHFDFLVNYNTNTGIVAGDFDDEIRSSDCSIHHIPAQWDIGPLKYKKLLKQICDEVHPDIIHIHMNAKSGIIAWAARMAGVEKVIVHSHADLKIRGHWAKVFLNKLELRFQKWLIAKYATHFWGCSVEANRSLFYPRLLDNKRSAVINNAIDAEKFAYPDVDVVKSLKASYNFSENTLILGNVGRVVRHKNISFILQLLEEYKKQGKEVAFVFAGRGADEAYLAEFWAEAKERGVNDRIRHLGVRYDVENVMATFDVFVGPALQEGFGLVAVEAQAAGVPSVLYKGFPRSVDVGEDMIEFKGDFNIKSWSSAIDRIASIEKPDNLITSIKSCGLDIQENTRLIEEKYSKL